MIGLPSGISFQPNPLYSNQGFVSSPLTNGMVGVLPPALYANLVNNNQQQQGYLNLGGSSHFASPASASASPVHIYSHIYPSSHSTTNQVTRIADESWGLLFACLSVLTVHLCALSRTHILCT